MKSAMLTITEDNAGRILNIRALALSSAESTMDTELGSPRNLPSQRGAFGVRTFPPVTPDSDLRHLETATEPGQGWGAIF